MINLPVVTQGDRSCHPPNLLSVLLDLLIEASLPYVLLHILRRSKRRVSEKDGYIILPYPGAILRMHEFLSRLTN